MKVDIERARERDKTINQTRQILKQFLYALHKSEGYGETRLLRTLYEWADTYEYVNNPKNNSNDEMLMIDNVLEKVIGKYTVLNIGREPINRNERFK